MDFELALNKTLDENATSFFEKSKLFKKKKLGLDKAILFQEKKSLVNKESKTKIIRKKKWFEKFRWFTSSDNFLVIGGKNAKMNEEIIKNFMKKEDVYFHADVFGAPHCVIKTRDEQTNKQRIVPQTTMLETAQFAVTFSKAFEANHATADAYSVKPEQVSKRAPTGTSLGVGAFMIYGERQWFKKTPMSIAIGINQKEQTLMAGPLTAIKKRCSRIIELKQGTLEKNVTAKKIQHFFSEKNFVITIDEILSLLPNGSFDFA